MAAIELITVEAQISVKDFISLFWLVVLFNEIKFMTDF